MASQAQDDWARNADILVSFLNNGRKKRHAFRLLTLQNLYIDLSILFITYFICNKKTVVKVANSLQFTVFQLTVLILCSLKSIA